MTCFFDTICKRCASHRVGRVLRRFTPPNTALRRFAPLIPLKTRSAFQTPVPRTNYPRLTQLTQLRGEKNNTGVLLFPKKKIRRFAAGFCCFQKFPPPAAGIYCCPKIRMFVAKFHRFCLEKTQNFPAASRRGLVIQKFTAASRRGFVVSKICSAASRRGFVISRFLRKVDSGDLQWGGGLNVISPVVFS